jgi:hypothetical protein
MNPVTAQLVLNSGLIWRLEGAMGRTATDMMREGLVMLGPTQTTDFWGNRVPSRYDVKPGTTGSRELVVERMGEEYAQMLDLVPHEPTTEILTAAFTNI